jgi:hypothetical protein
MTRTAIAPVPLPIAIGRMLDTLGFRLVIKACGRRVLCWPTTSKDDPALALPGDWADILLNDECEHRGANKALTSMVVKMSQPDMEAMFAAFGESETTETFDFREQMSA